MLIAKCKKNIDPWGNKQTSLVVGQIYDVEDIVMDRWHTDIYLKGRKDEYNSVMFDFYENGKEIDIYKDSRFNPYLKEVEQ